MPEAATKANEEEPVELKMWTSDRPECSYGRSKGSGDLCPAEQH